MNEIKKMNFTDRLRNAIRAFKGKPISTLYLGMDVKRCDQCEYKAERSVRDDLLVTAGARAAYMNDFGSIVLPTGIVGEAKLAEFASTVVDRYLNQTRYRDINYDEYIESALQKEYGGSNEHNRESL